MNNTNDLQSPTTATAELGNDITSTHAQLMSKYANVNPDDVKLETAAAALMSFNGYYSLNSTGAFFTIDTNMLITSANATPIYDISLIVSLDGTTSQMCSFDSSAGTFDGKRLIVSVPGFPKINITLTRGGAAGATATLSGTSQIGTGTPQTINGTTYNNIIPMSMYQGTYYEKIVGIFHDPMMEIGANFVLKYKKDGIGEILNQVDAFIYNMNMYYFSFTLNGDTIKLIMGTSADGGLVCNNMIVPPGVKPKVETRSLQTIKTTASAGVKTSPNSLCEEIAQFSGFYLISSQDTSIKPGAFVSVQGEYTVATASSAFSYTVQVGVSLDGIYSDVYYLDGSTTLTSDSITIPSSLTGNGEIVFNFTPGYKADPSGRFGTLVNLSGSLNGTAISGATSLCPVPLSAFGGAPYTSPSGSIANDTLTIVSDKEITFNGTSYCDFVYVPLMYILYVSTIEASFLLSLGTSGGKGTACIITVINPTPGISVVYGIPTGHTGQPTLPTS